MTVNPATVIRTLRQLKAAGVRTRSMHSDAIQYITDNKLAREVNWPAGFIEITPAGAEYIAENGGDE